MFLRPDGENCACDRELSVQVVGEIVRGFVCDDPSPRLRLGPSDRITAKKRCLTSDEKGR